jgi:hypothetical protein
MKTIDSSDTAIKSLLEKVEANENWPLSKTSQKTAKLAACIFTLDAAGITDQAVRDAVMKAFMATTSGFGCNVSQMNQAFGWREAVKKAEVSIKGM